jgi:hypothetical protein
VCLTDTLIVADALCCDKQVTGDKRGPVLAVHILALGFPLLECGPSGPLGLCAVYRQILTSRR